MLAASMRLGHIPAGSTDAVAYSLNGTRSQQTAALHIAIGDRCGGDSCSKLQQQLDPNLLHLICACNVLYKLSKT